MKVLVLNCGSSSLKYQVIDMETEETMCSGNFERIGSEKSFLTHKVNGQKIKLEEHVKDHAEALEHVMGQITHEEYGIIKELSEIDAIGHRIVQGGDRYSHSVLVDDKVIKDIEELASLAPLHNPPALLGIDACKKVMPGTPMAVVFDTAFHQTLPEHRYIYPIPYEYYEKYGVRKYGAHGTSHRYISVKLAEELGRDDLNIISCHLGNGASVAAIKNGKCIDTSMGLTPLEGLIMGTRSGDLDPAVLEFVMRKENLSISQMTEILNKKSGLLGITNVTGDVRDLKELSKKGDQRAELALEMFGYRVKKYIGSYMAALGHVDAIIFEGGIGEHNPDVVNRCVEGLEELGIVFDDSHNSDEQYEGIISKPESKIKMYVIPTNEELKIAEETMELLK